MKTRFAACSLLAGASLLSFADVALAQSNTAANAAPTAENATDANDIIVTARRRKESIQTTPVAVTAITPGQLEAVATPKITDLQGAAPNVLITLQSTGAATANISIRGIAFADVEKSFDPAVGVNVDGVYIGTSTGQLLDFFDIESIEILRGPQGTLFGRNTIAGVINVRRTRPTGELGLKFETNYGSYGEFGIRAVANAPIVKDLLAVKLFEFHQESDGFLKNFFTDKHVGGSNNENFGASFLLTPGDKFSALLTLEEQNSDFRLYQSTLTSSSDVFGAFAIPEMLNRNTTDDLYTVFPGFEPQGKYDAKAATLELNFDAGFANFTSITSYRKSKETLRQDYGTAGVYDATRKQDYEQFSQELRMSGKLTDSFDYVAGLYYFDSKYNLKQDTVLFGGAVNTFQDTTGKSESYAAFLDVNWEVIPRVRISGGGRYTSDTKQNINPLLSDPNGVVGVSAKESWDNFSPKIGIDYRPSNDLMAYFVFSQGYRSGGFNGRGQTYFSATTPFNPESVDSYEIGLKSEWFDRKLALNVAAFYTDYSDIQQSTTVTSPTGQGNETITVNAAGAEIKGFEADLTARPVDHLVVRASLGYTDSNFKDFLVDQPTFGVVRTFDFSNVKLIYAPNWTASINGEYGIPIGNNELKLTAAYRYLSTYDQQVAADPTTPIGTAPATIVVERNDPRLRSDTQHLVDASITYQFNLGDFGRDGAKARVTLYGRNLLDDRGTQTAFTVAAFPTLWSFGAAREPRVMGVQFGFQF